MKKPLRHFYFSYHYVQNSSVVSISGAPKSGYGAGLMTTDKSAPDKYPSVNDFSRAAVSYTPDAQNSSVTILSITEMSQVDAMNFVSGIKQKNSENLV